MATVILVLLAIFYQPDIPVDALKTRYALSPSQFTLVHGMSTHFRDEGSQTDSIPLVLLHGTSSSLLTWDACAKAWKNKHRIVRMDLPGFGLTGPHPNNDYSIDAYVDFLEKFLRDRNISQCYLAGNSLGGLIAYTYAARFPFQVKKLILIDAAGYPIEHAKGSLAFKLGKIPVIKNLLTVITPSSIVRKSLEDAYGNTSLVTDALVEQYRDMACREGNREALLQRLQTDQKGDTTIVSQLNQPTLILWGEQDQLIPVANAYKFQRDVPQDTLVVFSGVGHVPMEERPEQVAPVVLHFLNHFSWTE
ncbi:MAG: alpha/beta hydrolase [Cyclobacteriaceae bacterium]|nr:alpha/beta hydrolase [Cyclobacteriaceae bacterium]